MKLSEFKLECIKEQTHYADNGGLTLDLVKQDQVSDSKYKLADTNFWNACNNFFARLSNRSKLHLVGAKLTITKENYSKENTYNLSSFSYNKSVQIGKVLGCVINRDKQTYQLGYRQFDSTNFLFLNDLEIGDKIYLQFAPILPRFNQNDILNDADIDLYTEYNINDNMLSVGILYVKALLNTDVDKEVFSNYLNIASSYLEDLPKYGGDTCFFQSRVSIKRWF